MSGDDRCSIEVHDVRLVLVHHVLFLVALVFGLVHVAYHFGYTLDDAYISYRYARNCAQGLGLVYNPGVYVKGYSNTLLTTLAVIPEWFGTDPKLFVKVLSLGAYVLLLVMAYRLYSHTEASRLERACGVWLTALCAASTPLAVHFVNGLETGLYTLLLFAAIVCRVREQKVLGRPYSALLFALLVLSRPEGVALFAAIALYDLGWRISERRLTSYDVVFYALPSGTYCAELLWSSWYYGNALPQTYYAKTNEMPRDWHVVGVLLHGLRKQFESTGYFRDGLVKSGLGIGGLLLIPLALLNRQERRLNGAFLAALLGQLVFIIRARSDWAPAFRFGAPLLPLLFALQVEGIKALGARARRWSVPLSWGLATLVLIASVVPQVRESIQVQSERFVNAENKLVEGAFLASLANPGSTLSSFDIGGFGYAARGFDILDTAALTDPNADCRRVNCGRYAALILPDVIRLHRRRSRDAFVTNVVTKRQAYLSVRGGKYLLRRSQAFLSDFSDAVQKIAPNTSLSSLAAHDAPPVVTPNSSMQLTLYWRRNAAADISILTSRHFEWISGESTVRASASESILKHADAVWKEHELLGDFATVRVPADPGTYSLAVSAGNVRIVLRDIMVLSSREAASKAVELIAAAESERRKGNELEALSLLAVAARLSPTARVPYYALATSRARTLREQARVAEKNSPETAFGFLREERRLLLRAFGDGGVANAELRNEIDANVVARDGLLRRLLR